MSDPAPIALFTYNRPNHTKHCLESLMANLLASESSLYIFSDGPPDNPSPEQIRSIEETRKVIGQKKWCKEVIIRENPFNLGLATNIMNGVTEVVDRYGKVIVFEDDNLLSPGTLKYLNQALDFYASEKRVMHISSFMFPVKETLPETFFYRPTTCSGGWATWQRAWRKLDPDPVSLLNKLMKSGDIKKFNLDDTYNFLDHLQANVDGRLNSWAIRWQTSVFLNNGLSLHPGISLVQNTGFDSGGVHSTRSHKSLFHHEKLAEKIDVKPIPMEENQEVREIMKRFYYKHYHPGILIKVRRKLHAIYYKLAGRIFPSS